MIKTTRHSGTAQIIMRRELGEWGARGMALATPSPGTKAPFPLMPEGGPAVTIAWLHPLSHARNAVHSITPLAGD